MHALITCNCACAVAQAHSLSHARVILFRSGVGTYGPRAECGSSRHSTWPATFYCHPACNLFLFSMIDMQQQTAEIILTLILKLLPKNGQNIWQRPFFFLVFGTNSTEKKPEFRAKTFLFWSARMVAVRWNLVRTEFGPLAQKVADTCSRSNCARVSENGAKAEQRQFVRKSL